ncbi:MAG: hypothetical protein AB8B87_14690 [Granulosicoccus sp.]
MQIRKFCISVIVSTLTVVCGNVIAQTHERHSAGMSHSLNSSVLPVESGQSAFAAIAEIVAILEADPHTDWSVVNIEALRSHLVDMDQLMLSAVASTQDLAEAIVQFKVTGQGRTLDSIRRMVPTHARMVGALTSWEISVIQESEGVILRIDPGSPEAFAKLKALGFFGFMTIGAHHQAHHLQMAKGRGH